MLAHHSGVPRLPKLFPGFPHGLPLPACYHLQSSLQGYFLEHPVYEVIVMQELQTGSFLSAHDTLKTPPRGLADEGVLLITHRGAH